jgi:5'-methylthioadenosine phosphorylase
MGALPRVETAIIGGSGLYALAGLDGAAEVSVDTPYGRPSDRLRVGQVAGKQVAFLARHGAGHRLLPSEIDFRANIFALKLLGVERILSASAVGSMRETIHPRDVVLVDQFVDRSAHRPATFFGDGIVAHIAFADPVCPETRTILLDAARRHGARAHDGGVYLCMEGPAFSTRAESNLYRSWGVDVIGMTNLQEAKLAREAEICYATLGLVTDYDCWHLDEDDVSVAELLANLRANAKLAAEVLREAITHLPRARERCACGDALEHAILTDLAQAPAKTLERLKPIVGRYLPVA